ncbi:MAG: Spy/CpxP family protein refolding chaperone [Planctomycetota bacterium]
MDASRFRSLHLSRTVPTAAAMLMIVTGIALAQSTADDPLAPSPDAAQAAPSEQAEAPGELTRQERRERRRQAAGQCGDRQGSPNRMREGDERGPRRQGRPGGPGGPGERQPGDGVRMLMRDVNLTDDQREQVRVIVREAAGPMQQYLADNAAALREARDAMDQARADRDREAGQAARQRLRELRQAGPQVDREALTAQIRELLNASQQEVFDANLAQAQERRERREAKRKERMEQGAERGDRPERRQRPDRPAGPQDAPPPGDQLDL